ncbi:DNA topoisomerase IB [Gymnodinialimonas ulvae]|uniref:DNA topoisomerase IB n=1 Tax=Gymnodinialimonas ulvae TaxID=3126504 RepID=UPI0030ADCD3C
MGVAASEDLCRQLGLIFYPDSEPGITRSGRGTGFIYRAPDGNRITDAKHRAALDALAIPPAYSEVWLSPHRQGHLLATGRDAAGRKQYRYHPDWTRHHQERKFEHLSNIGPRLPRLRRWISRQIRSNDPSEEAAVATILCLIDRHSLRVGHPDYSRQNGSFAATTLQQRHLIEMDEGMMLAYSAKGGAKVTKSGLSQALRRRLHIGPDGARERLVGWRDARGRWRAVQPGVVVDTMREILDCEVTPRLMRTWNGSRAAFLAARAAEQPTIKHVSTAAAQTLHNTPTIARNSYIHPGIIDAVRDGAVLPKDRTDAPELLRIGEDGMTAFLRASD